MGNGPRSAVVAPPALPPRVGLYASAPVSNETGDRWELGFTYLPESCGTGGVADPCDNATKTIDANPTTVEFDPFVVWAGDKCSSFGFDAHDFPGRARRLLEACESFQVAHELWTGDLAQAQGFPNAFLASTASDEVSSSAVTPIIALSCLEQGLAECACGERGMIHATRQIVSIWSQNQMLRREGGLTLTINDTIVVADAGYDGSAPDGSPAADGSIWAYATGMVTVRHGPVDVVPGSFAEALDRSVNTIEFRAERLAAATFDPCCHLAVEIDADLCTIGGS